jgi:hypothetical protein
MEERGTFLFYWKSLERDSQDFCRILKQAEVCAEGKNPFVEVIK